MITSEKNQKRYERLQIDLTKLKAYYVNRAEQLLKCLENENDNYAIELKSTLESFINNPEKDLIDLIEEIKISNRGYNSFGINDTLFDISYPDNELIEKVLNPEQNVIRKYNGQYDISKAIILK